MKRPVVQGPVRTSALLKQDSEVRCSDSDYKGATEAMGWARGMGAGAGAGRPVHGDGDDASK